MKRKQIAKLFDQLLEQMYTGEVIKVFVESHDAVHQPVKDNASLWVATKRPFAMRFIWIDLYLYIFDGDSGEWNKVDWEALQKDMEHYRLLSVVV